MENSLSDETEKVMDYIGSDVNAEKVDELLDEESKKKLKKFLKCIFSLMNISILY